MAPDARRVARWVRSRYDRQGDFGARNSDESLNKVTSVMATNVMRRGWLRRPAVVLGAFVFGVVSTGVLVLAAHEFESGIKWLEPRIVDPGPVGGHPADAVVLFDGKDLSQWKGGDAWEIRDGYAITRKHDISTKEAFGDCQLHIEWATPDKVVGSGQGRGNSGVYMMGLYEVQVLDSYINKTYFDGQAGSIYKQHPPMVNVCRKPGEWQSYDIIFNGPRFNPDGSVKRPAVVTVLQNGVVVQNHFHLLGATYYDRPPKYAAHPPKLPITLQFHHNATRFRNIWIREIHEPPKADADSKA
jgi:hypothetical protein